jgi:hypothetical protein
VETFSKNIFSDELSITLSVSRVNILHGSNCEIISLYARYVETVHNGVTVEIFICLILGLDGNMPLILFETQLIAPQDTILHICTYYFNLY